MEKKKDEQVIYLKDLLFAALHAWKALIAVALVFAALLGGFRFFTSWNGRKAAMALQSSPDHQLAIEEYQQAQAELEFQLENLEQTLDAKMQYLEDSILMQLDPYNHYEAMITLTVDTGYQIDPTSTMQAPDKTEHVTFGYNALVTDDQVLQAMADAVASEPQYMKELIFTSRPNNSTLQVRIKYLEKEDTRTLSEIMAQHLTDNKGIVAAATTSHTISGLTQAIVPTVDLNVATVQQAARDSSPSISSQIEEIQLQKESLVKPAVSVASAFDVIKEAAIFAVVGGVIGILLAVVAAWVMHITGNKVYSAKTLTNRTGVKVLGSIRCACAGFALDRLINKAEGRNCNDIHAQAKLLAVNVRNRCANAKQLLVISDTEDAAKEALIEALCSTLSGIRIDNYGSLLQDAAALEALASCDAVLMVKQCQHSLYTATEQECAIVADSGKTLLGCILLNG